MNMAIFRVHFIYKDRGKMCRLVEAITPGSAAYCIRFHFPDAIIDKIKIDRSGAKADAIVNHR